MEASTKKDENKRLIRTKKSAGVKEVHPHFTTNKNYIIGAYKEGTLTTPCFTKVDAKLLAG